MNTSHEDEHCDDCAQFGLCSCPECVEADTHGYWSWLRHALKDHRTDGGEDAAE